MLKKLVLSYNKNNLLVKNVFKKIMIHKHKKIYRLSYFLKSRLMMLIFLLTSSSVLTGCYFPIKTEEESNLVKSPYLITKPIYFYLHDTNSKKSSIYFLLYYNVKSNRYFIKVKWLYYSNQRPYINIRNSLKMELDNQVELLFSAIKPPRLTKINIEPRGIEEEVLYEIDRPSLENIGKANKINIEINSKATKLKGYFMPRHSFKAIGEFLDTVDKTLHKD